MSISIINNQPIRFQNTDSIDNSCNCLGQGFCQLVNKNDVTKFQISTNDDLVSNGDFEDMLTDWDGDGSWDSQDSAEGAFAVYEGGGGDLTQAGILTIGVVYAITFEIVSSNPAYGVTVESLTDTPSSMAEGVYSHVGVAISEDLVFSAIGAAVRIKNIIVGEIPMYSIKDSEGNIIFTLSDETGVTALGETIQYELDWTDTEEGCYQVYISDGIIDYVSDCLTVKLAHDCTLLLSWTNNEDAYGFNYSDLSFTQLLRVEAKKWQPSYTKEKTVFKDNAGNRYILKSETSKEELLTIAEMPQYLHDCLAIGLEHDDFYIDSVKYTNEETEYSPKWRKSSQLAPSEVVVIKDQLLKNNNC